tara:strand:- start:6005 stop:6298 length:294 start_codon:yes stop_codon:yes gene_type:complete
MDDDKINLHDNLLDNDKDKDKNKNNITNNIFFILGISYVTCVSTICSLYIILIYKDVHDTYLNFNNGSYNITELYAIKNQLEFLNNCITEKYCKRIN